MGGSYQQSTSRVSSWTNPILIYINDLDSHIVSSILKFADDTKLFSTVNNDSDRAALQSDLHKLLEWSDKWQMPFSISKCKLMHLGRNNTRFHYVIDSHLLEEVSEEKDLGVFISDNLKPAKQGQEAYNKASKALRIIARTISFKDKVILLQL